MTPQMQALRALGDAVLVVGAWRHRPTVIIAGVGIVLFAYGGEPSAFFSLMAALLALEDKQPAGLVLRPVAE